METVVVQDSGIEASHGATMEDFSMDERAAVVEGTETCQGELTIEDGSVGNGTIDADETQSHEAERVSNAQGVQMVVSNGLMDSGGIVGAGSQLGAAEDVEEEVVGNASASKKKKKKRGKRAGQQPRLSGYQKQDFQRQRDEATL